MGEQILEEDALPKKYSTGSIPISYKCGSICESVAADFGISPWADTTVDPIVSTDANSLFRM